MTPDITLVGFRFRSSVSTKDEVTSAAFDQIIVDVFLGRPLGYFLWEVYMPATFIVIISFSSFWLDRSSTPARVSLGVTTVLTITTLLSSANLNLPPTAYPKSIGVFLAGCFVFTFLAFLEYSAASYLERRRSLGKGLPPSSSETATGGEEEEAGKYYKKRRFTLAGMTDPMGLRPSQVDVYSRILFPVAFCLFQAIYWSVSFLSLTPYPEDVVVLVR